MPSIADKLRSKGVKLEKLVGGMIKNETSPAKESGSFVLNSGTKDKKSVKMNG